MARFAVGFVLGVLLAGGAAQAFEMYLSYTVDMEVSGGELERTCERRCEIVDEYTLDCRSATFSCSGSDYIYDENASLSCEAD